MIWLCKTDRTTGTFTNMQCFPCVLRFTLGELLTLISKGLAWTVVITFSLSLHREQCQRHKTERRTRRGHESLYINTHTGHWCAILTNTLEARQNDEKTGYMTWGRHFSTFEVCGCFIFFLSLFLQCHHLFLVSMRCLTNKTFENGFWTNLGFVKNTNSKMLKAKKMFKSDTNQKWIEKGSRQSFFSVLFKHTKIHVEASSVTEPNYCRHSADGSEQSTHSFAFKWTSQEIHTNNHAF